MLVRPPERCTKHSHSSSLSIRIGRTTTMRMGGAMQEQSTTVLRRSFLAPIMRRRGERFRKSLVRTATVEDLRTPGFALVHHAGVLELLDQRFFSSEERNDHWLDAAIWRREGKRTGSLRSSSEGPSQRSTCSFMNC